MPQHIPSLLLPFPQSSVGFYSTFKENLLHSKNISLSSPVLAIVLCKSLVCSKWKLCVFWMNLTVLPLVFHKFFTWGMNFVPQKHFIQFFCPALAVSLPCICSPWTPRGKCWWMDRDSFCNWRSSVFKSSSSPRVAMRGLLKCQAVSLYSYIWCFHGSLFHQGWKPPCIPSFLGKVCLFLEFSSFKFLCILRSFLDF